MGDELERSDCFVLLLSAQAAGSEMITEEVGKAKALRDARSDGKPVLLPIRVSFPVSAPLNYNLRGYLNAVEQRFWNSDADTPALLRELRARARSTEATGSRRRNRSRPAHLTPGGGKSGRSPPAGGRARTA
jgi:serine/threonine-protein kinase